MRKFEKKDGSGAFLNLITPNKLRKDVYSRGPRPVFKMGGNHSDTRSDCRDSSKNRFSEVIARFGSPISIHSDLGSNYESRIFTELYDLLEIKRSRTSFRNRKGNGQTERFMKILVHMKQRGGGGQ